jgi:hypothetical protein
MSDRNFADLAEVSYRVKLNAAEVIGADRMRIIDPAFSGGEQGVDLNGFEVPLYRSPQSGEIDPNDLGWNPQRRSEALQEQRGEGAPPR